MLEESKLDIANTQALLAPFTQTNLVMEKIFVSTKNHGISIQELWDQINRLKEATGIHKNKDGISVSKDSLDGTFDDKVNKTVNVGNDKSNELKPENENQQTEDAAHPDIPLENDQQLSKQSQPDADQITSLKELVDKQQLKINKIEAQLKSINDRAEDKYQTYDDEINKFIKNNFEDANSKIQSLEENLSKFKEDSKEKDFNIREHFRIKFEDLEVSLRSVKRNISSPIKEKKSPKVKLNVSHVVASPQKQNEDNNEIKRSYTDREIDKDEVHGQLLQPLLTDKSSDRNANANMNGLDLVWDEIEQLRKKFNDFVQFKEFHQLGTEMDDLNDKIEQIAKQGNFDVQIEGELDFEEDQSPTYEKEEDDAKENEEAKAKSSEHPSRPRLRKSSTELVNAEKEDNKDVSSMKNAKSDQHKGYRTNQNFSNKAAEAKETPGSKPKVNTRGNRRGNRGNSKTLLELKRIAEAWPIVHSTIDELKSAQKLNYKNIFSVNESLSEFKKEINDALKKRTDSLFNTIVSKIKDVHERIEDTLESEEFKPAMETLKVVELKCDKLNLQFEAVHSNNKAIEESLKELQEFKDSPFSNLVGNDGQGNVDEALVNEIKESVLDLKHNMVKLKQELFKTVKEQEAKLFKKADEEIVNDLEEALHQGIDQVMRQGYSKFSDKRETNKAIRLLERNLKNMYDLFINKDEGFGGDTDDAMLARKHFGFTCMS